MDPSEILLIKSDLPDLLIKTYKVFDKGWDSCVFLINDKYIFRFPRREDTAQCLTIERKILPELKNILDLAIPEFKFFSKSFDDYKTSFVGYEKIPGIEFTHDVFIKLSEQNKTKSIISQIGKFLSQLHSFPVYRALQLGVKELRNHEWWSSYFNEIRKKAFVILSNKQRNWTQNLFTNFLDDKEIFNYQSVLIHADLGGEHILVDETTGEILGIIDFGDIALGDPAYDFYQLGRDFGGDFLEEIIHNYTRQLDNRFRQRMEFYRCVVGFHLILGGINLNKEHEVQRGLRILEQVID